MSEPTAQASVAHANTREATRLSVAAIILNWNQTELTLACLRSLYAMERLPDHVIIIDNGSRPESSLGLSAIAAEFPQATLIRNGRNLGFAGGNNAGIRHALASGAGAVLLLNNDAEVAPDLLRLLVDFAETDARIGVAGPLIYFYDDPQRVWFAGGQIEAATGRGQSLDSWNGELVPKQVDWISGCALLIKRSVIEQIGLLDERMFAYYEDVDWCARAHEAGYQVWLAPQARVWHKIEMQERLLSPWYVYLMTRNQLLFGRNRGATGWQLLRRTVRQDVWQALNWSLNRRYRDRRPLARYKLRGVIDFLRNSYGEPPFGMEPRV